MSRHFFIALLIIELLIAVAIGGGACILRLDQQKAFRAMRENPSEVAKAEWKRQQGITRWHNAALSGIIFVMLATPTYLVYKRVGPNRKPKTESLTGRWT
jgi:hypothetical protein